MKNKTFITVVLLFVVNSILAQDQFVGEIRVFAGNFAPIGWAKCEGQIMSISQNTALYSLLGTTYGGNGTSTFALPDMRERVAIHPNQGPGLSLHDLGEASGNSLVTLTPENLPAHNHTAQIKVSSGVADLSAPTVGVSLAAPVEIHNSTSYPVLRYTTASPNVTLSTNTTSVTGGSDPINISQPYLVCTYIIALQGIYPQHN
jgi:microcystin-dependent protein